MSSGSVIVALLFVLRAGAPARLTNLTPLHGWRDHVEFSKGDDVQVVYLPALLPREAQISSGGIEDVAVPYTFDAFGRRFKLELMPNRRLVSPDFRVWLDGGKQEPQLSILDSSCHFLHSGPSAVAAFSACSGHSLHGLIVAGNITYEVRPLRSARSHSSNDGRIAHMIRRAPPPQPPVDDAWFLRPKIRRPRIQLSKMAKPSSYTIEIALFLDEAGYKIFHPFLNYNEEYLRDMLLAYINGVQALFQHASLGTRIQLSLVRLTLLRRQPVSLTTHGERGKLLDSFCEYQRSLNFEDDADPQHWDMALLLSGIDFFSEEGGRRNGVTMGLAPVGGVCLPAHACVVSEFGVTDSLGRPYPSAGFTSVYILAHEIGHNLGMHHDGTGNTCARDGFIMSPSRGTNGEAVWSACSAIVAANLQWATCLYDGEDGSTVPNALDHERFNGAPGTVWTAKKQCEILLRDTVAAPSVKDESDVCSQLSCRSPQRAGFYFAGPALPGTPCGKYKWCQGGECVPTIDETPTVENHEGWSQWKEGACQSGCTMRARGFRERRRECAQAAMCNGPAYEVVLCNDTKICGKKSRVNAIDFASRKCTEYAKILKDLDEKGGGLQAPHDPTRMWMGCAVFCRRSSGSGFYAPRVELYSAGLDPYFPDGTWCHHDGTQNFYCMQHHCLPENFKMIPQRQIWDLPSDDIGGPFNARAFNSPEDAQAAAAIKAYLSLDRFGMPLVRSALPPQMPIEPEHNWEVDDYVELPIQPFNNT